MRNYCRYLFTIFLMLPVLVCADPSIIVSSHNGTVETFKPSGNGSEFNLNNHQNTTIEVPRDIKYTISKQQNTFFEIKKSKNQWDITHSEDIGVYKSGNTLKAGLNRTPKKGTKRTLEDNEIAVISHPAITAVISPESPIANASSVLFVVAPQHQQFFSNIASQVTAINTYAETSVFDISQFANNQLSSVIIGHIWQDNIAKFVNGNSLSKFMAAAGGREKNKITLVFDLNLHGVFEQKDFYMSLISKINESLKPDSGKIVNITFLSLSSQQDEELVDQLTRHAKGVLKLNGKNETVHHRVLKEVTEESIADALGINFQFTQQNVQATSSEPTIAELQNRVLQSKIASNEEKVKTHQMKQKKLLDKGNLYPTVELQNIAAESNQAVIAEESEESLEKKLTKKQDNFQKVNNEINKLENKEVNGRLDEEESEKLEKLKQGKKKLQENIKNTRNKLESIKTSSKDQEEVDSDDEFMDLISK